MTTYLGAKHWKPAVLQDLIHLQRGFDITKAQQKEGDVPVFSSSGLSSWHDEAKAHGPGVIIGRKGTLGSVHYCEGDFWPHDTTLWSKSLHGNNARFVYYALKCLGLERFNVGGANPTLNRNHIHGLPIRLPERHVQDDIASILSAYDELIENNRRRIALLEEAARMLYREWFVHFRFPGHEHVKITGGLPEGWERRLLFEEADATYGHAFKSELFNETAEGVPVVRIRDVPNGTSNTWTTEEAPADRRLANGDFLIGMDGDFHMNFWAGGDAWLNQRVTRIGSKGRIGVGLLRFALERPIKNLNETITGTTVKHLGAKHLKTIDLVVPPAPLLSQANEFCENARGAAVNLSIQNQQLAQARELLLPRLMNGEIAI